MGRRRVTADKLRALDIATVGQVARLPEAFLVSILGRAPGRHLHALAHNRDPRPVQARPRRRSMGAQRALGRKPRTQDELAVIVVGLVDRLARRLRKAHRICRTVVLRLRFDDFSRATRSHTLSFPTARTRAILATALDLLTAAGPTIERKGLTLVGISLSNLEGDGTVQLELPFDRRPADVLDAAVDAVRDRFGSDAVTKAVLLGRGQGQPVPMLPDGGTSPGRRA